LQIRLMRNFFRGAWRMIGLRRPDVRHEHAARRCQFAPSDPARLTRVIRVSASPTEGEPGLRARLRAGLERLGVEDELHALGKRWLLMGNFNSPDAYPASSDLALVKAAARLFREAGCNITLGAGAGIPWLPTMDVIRELGVDTMAQRPGRATVSHRYRPRYLGLVKAKPESARQSPRAGSWCGTGSREGSSTWTTGPWTAGGASSRTPMSPLATSIGNTTMTLTVLSTAARPATSYATTPPTARGTGSIARTPAFVVSARCLTSAPIPRCRMRGRSKVAEQSLLTAACQNMKKIANALWKRDRGPTPGPHKPPFWSQLLLRVAWLLRKPNLQPV